MIQETFTSAQFCNLIPFNPFQNSGLIKICATKVSLLHTISKICRYINNIAKLITITINLQLWCKKWSFLFCILQLKMVRMTKVKKLRWVRHVTCTRRNHERMRLFRKQRRYNIVKMWISKKQDMTIWTRFYWLRINFSSRHLWLCDSHIIF